MRLGKLLALIELLEEYKPHARHHGYHDAAHAAGVLIGVATQEAKRLEHAAQSAQEATDNV